MATKRNSERYTSVPAKMGHTKSLLTPCRRVGLSRTKKTPKTPNLNSPSSSVEVLAIVDATPVKIKESKEDGKNKNFDNSEETPDSKRRKFGNKVNNKPLCDDILLNRQSKKTTPIIIKSETATSKTKSQELTKIHDNSQSMLNKLDEANLNQSITESAQENAGIVNNVSLSIDLKHLKLEKLNSYEQLSTSNSLRKANAKSKSIKRCLSLSLTKNKTNLDNSSEKDYVETISQECVVTEELLSQNENDSLFFDNTKANLVSNIKVLKSEIKQKEETLLKLKQAQVYKNKHDPLKLKELSLQWLNGCRSSLNDLLVQLKEHGPMSMDFLLNKLHIPMDIVEKLNGLGSSAPQ